MSTAARRLRSSAAVAEEDVCPSGVASQSAKPLTATEADELVHGLYRAHAVALIRTARLLLRDQVSAEDAVQDAFLGLYRALDRLTDYDDLLPYLRTAVVNRCRTVLRARRRALLRPAQHEPDASSAESAAMADEDRRAVLDAVSRLPRRSREVLVLRYFLDLDNDQVAATLGVSKATVSSTASRAIAALGKTLKEQL